MKKPVIITFIIGLVLLGFFYLLPVLVNNYLNKNAERIVSNMILRTSDFVGHEVNFGKIRLDYNYRGTFLKMDSVSIYPGKEITDKMGQDEGSQGENYRLIELNHFRVNKADFINKDSKSDSTRLLINDLFVFADGFSLSDEDIKSQEAIFSVDIIEGYLGEVQLHVNDYINVIQANDLSFNILISIGLIKRPIGWR